ncbi:adhesin [Leptospira adleri]|uniref:Adhesin n=1 Tax=Leptospira adleri TaxID=2023186 RepID=A0A2M9YJX8_9LEPT|nr:DUF1566 domain-containing protein [Leptospira adleri]PJZ51842.1 adhesin [Leptospira adleri]PJZ59910.1 adhesin [Leptospira adleri]
MNSFLHERRTSWGRGFLGILILFISCAKADRVSFDSSSSAGLFLQISVPILNSIGVNSDNAKEITSFRFTGSDNFFADDFVGIISGNQITINAPFGAIRRLKAGFVSTGNSVLVEDVVQRSGQTQNDFSSPKIYRISAVNGTTQEYTVRVNPVFRLTDAGQTNCYSTCSSNPGQDADYSTGVPTSFQSNVVLSGHSSEPVTFDRQTGLVWKYCAKGPSNTTCGTPDASLFYPDAVSACSSLNVFNGGAGYAGITTWRVPEIEEFMTLTEHASPLSGFIRVSDFPDGVFSFWSNTEDSTNPLRAWSFHFGTDQALTNGKTSGSMGVRCVSGAPIPSRAFVDLNDGTVLDNRTGLIWQKCTKGQTWSSAFPDCSVGATIPENWNSALGTCNHLNLAGRIWRLPNINELRSLIDFASSSAIRIDNTAFPNIPAPNPKYHSSNSVPGGIIFKVNFSIPEINTVDGPSSVSLTRCVADGP